MTTLSEQGWRDAEQRLLEALNQPPSEQPQQHPYERLAQKFGLEFELASALIAEAERRAERCMEAIDRGEYKILPRPEYEADDLWADLDEEAERDEEAIVRGGWAEAARREFVTFGRPQLRTVLRLASGRRLPESMLRRPRRREAGVRRRSGSGRRTRNKSAAGRDDDPHPAAARLGGVVTHVVAFCRPSRPQPTGWVV
jgi:hypothetical protein